MSLFAAIGECMVELSAAGDDLWRLGIAGDTLNTAWYARARLPQDWEVSYVTRLGQDAFSDRAVAFLAANGIATRHVSRHPDRSIGLYAIALQAGERSFAYWRDTSAARTLMEAPETVHAALDAAAALHLSGITLAILPDEARDRLLALVGQARSRGALTAFDPNHRARLWPDAATARRVIGKAAGVASVVLPSFEDEAGLFGDAAPEATVARYLALGAGLVVVKTGGGAVTIGAPGQPVRRVDLPTVTPLDTTGAGDSFNGAFLAAWLTGSGAEAAVRAAHGLALRVVQHRGALMPMEIARQG
jgi:2-dehydro-3-deoxygluconokinase